MLRPETGRALRQELLGRGDTFGNAADIIER